MGNHLLLAVCLVATPTLAREPDRLIDVWPDLAPGETARSTGEKLPRRPQEDPPATRVNSITRPQLAMFKPSADSNATAIVVLPGGGYNYVVTDKEGSEVADWLGKLGVTTFVLHYRTKNGSDQAAWQRPLQDGQRAIRLLRSQAAELEIASARIGVLGFSAGGQAAALIATRGEHPAYVSSNEVDNLSCRPDFALLIYPWRLVDKDNQLMPEITIGKQTPPTFLVHAHNDRATSMSSVVFYSRLKQYNVPSGLHIFESGGHGYGLRPVAGSNIHTWPDRATDWLRQRGLVPKPH